MATETTGTTATAGTAGTTGPELVRRLGAHLELDVDGPATLALQIAAADGARRLQEQLEVTADGAPVDGVRELATAVGGRTHLLQVRRGRVVVDYRAVVAGPPAGRETSAPGPQELLEATRPSRYVDSDRLVALATAETGGAQGLELARAVTAWVGRRLAYVPGSSRPTDAASDTLLAGQGVCRDYAHLVAGILRARDVPARVTAVYAPGLSPMDFHAVAEAWVEGAWHLLDATGLAPRSSLVRIATGRDTADTAFLTTTGPVTLLGQEVTAVVEPDLPVDDGWSPVHLA